jgi:sulfur relay protein TusB/DsrH
MVLCILSGYDSSRLELASQIAEKSPKSKVVLLSDALYLVFDKKTQEKVKNMLGNGVSFYALDSDASKRGLNAASETVVLITYDILVELLLKNEDGIVNL